MTRDNPATEVPDNECQNCANPPYEGACRRKFDGPVVILPSVVRIIREQAERYRQALELIARTDIGRAADVAMRALKGGKP